MLRVDEFMAFLHERAEFPALSEQLFHDRLTAPVAQAVNDQTAEQAGSNAEHERQRQRVNLLQTPLCRAGSIGSDRLLCAMSTPMHGMMTPAGKPGRFMYSQKITPQTRSSPY